MAAAAVAALPEELVEEILLRLPPEKPASLFRASVVCKPWYRFISGQRFRRKFRELHRTPPMLGFLCSTSYVGAHFVPTTAFCVSPAHRCDWFVLDARHGRVLVQFQRYVPQEEEDEGEEEEEEDGPVLWVWDPITDEQRELPIPPRRGLRWAAAVLCAGTGACDHLDCHRGPFLVVFVEHDLYDETFVCTYSSDVDAWSEPISIQHPDLENYSLISLAWHPVLLGNALYFQMMMFTDIILNYSLESREMSCIQLPSSSSYTFEYLWRHYMLTTTKEGVLGLVLVHFPILSMWLRKDAPEDNAGWTQSTVIDLTKTSHPLVQVSTSPEVVGLADGLGIVFITVENDLYTIDLKTSEVELYQDRASEYIVPYMSFYTPELEAACTGEGPNAGGSSA